MNQFVKFLPAIASLLCLVIALLMQFVWHETTWALVIALLGLVIGQIPAPGTAARKRADQEAAWNREERKVRAQRRRPEGTRTSGAEPDRRPMPDGSVLVPVAIAAKTAFACFQNQFRTTVTP